MEKSNVRTEAKYVPVIQQPSTRLSISLLAICNEVLSKVTILLRFRFFHSQCSYHKSYFAQLRTQTHIPKREKNLIKMYRQPESSQRSAYSKTNQGWRLILLLSETAFFARSSQTRIQFIILNLKNITSGAVHKNVFW